MPSRRREPRWLGRVVVDAIHADQLREHGGLPGCATRTRWSPRSDAHARNGRTATSGTSPSSPPPMDLG